MNDKPCPDCSVSRRHFIKTTAAVTAASALPITLVQAKPEQPKAETLVKQFHDSLNEEQKSTIVMPFDHDLRFKVDNNWFLSKNRIGGFFNKDQQEMCKQIFMNLHNPEFADKALAQVNHDNRGDEGYKNCSVALFGEPGTGKFEFVFAGRHVTRRCDGDSVEGAAFGGPIFYGHSAASFNEEPDHPGNVYWFQAKRANELFQALDEKQQKQALLKESRGEHGNKTIELTGKSEGLAGLKVSDMSSDQKGLMRGVMEDMLHPFRKEDADESLKLVENAGFDDLHISYYQNEDIGKDGVWDVWQVEGPSMVWYFRGKPHVHTWLHIRDKA